MEKMHVNLKNGKMEKIARYSDHSLSLVISLSVSFYCLFSFLQTFTLFILATRAPTTCLITLGRRPQGHYPAAAYTCGWWRISSPQQSVVLAQPGRCMFAEIGIPALCRARGLPDLWVDGFASCWPSSGALAKARLLRTGMVKMCTIPDGSSARNPHGTLSEFVPTAGAVGRCGLAFCKYCIENATAGSTTHCGFATEHPDCAESYTAPWVLDIQMFCGARLHNWCSIGLTPMPSSILGRPCALWRAILWTARLPQR